jgi:hypothetical protein
MSKGEKNQGQGQGRVILLLTNCLYLRTAT